MKIAFFFSKWHSCCRKLETPKSIEKCVKYSKVFAKARFIRLIFSGNINGSENEIYNGAYFFPNDEMLTFRIFTSYGFEDFWLLRIESINYIKQKVLPDFILP